MVVEIMVLLKNK